MNPQQSNQNETLQKSLTEPDDQKPQEVQSKAETNSNLIKISESFHFKKFFKMTKFGVPAQAVKMKMISEGLDGDKLDNPDLMIEKVPEDYEEFEE